MKKKHATTGLIDTIHAAMQQRGVNQADLARLIGTSAPTVNRYLAGSVHPGGLVLQRMLDVLGLDPRLMLPPPLSPPEARKKKTGRRG